MSYKSSGLYLPSIVGVKIQPTLLTYGIEQSVTLQLIALHKLFLRFQFLWLTIFEILIYVIFK